MKKLINLSFVFILLQLSLSLSANAQDSKSPANQNNDQVFTRVEQMPEFNGGNKKMEEYLASNLKYPATSIENGISGKVYISFVVDRTGKIRDAKILRGIDKECDTEALRVVSSMPDWIPGKQNGKEVSVQFNLPINFNLAAPKQKTK